jgi:hypothetical protein
MRTSPNSDHLAVREGGTIKTNKIRTACRPEQSNRKFFGRPKSVSPKANNMGEDERPAENGDDSKYNSATYEPIAIGGDGQPLPPTADTRVARAQMSQFV